MKENTTYLVMEIHSAYAVLLDNEGRFVKAANMGYESGDVVRNPVLLKYPQDHRKRLHRMIRISAGIAACICFAIFGIYEYQYMFTPYGSVTDADQSGSTDHSEPFRKSSRPCRHK